MFGRLDGNGVETKSFALGPYRGLWLIVGGWRLAAFKEPTVRLRKEGQGLSMPSCWLLMDVEKIPDGRTQEKGVGACTRIVAAIVMRINAS